MVELLGRAFANFEFNFDFCPASCISLLIEHLRRAVPQSQACTCSPPQNKRQCFRSKPGSYREDCFRTGKFLLLFLLIPTPLYSLNGTESRGTTFDSTFSLHLSSSAKTNENNSATSPLSPPRLLMKSSLKCHAQFYWTKLQNKLKFHQEYIHTVCINTQHIMCKKERICVVRWTTQE